MLPPNSSAHQDFEHHAGNHVHKLETLAADDQDAMHAIGKEQVFKRKYNFLSALGFTICISATWEGMSAALLQAMLEGGPVGVLYGYLVTAVAMTVVAAVISELASIWPSSGAQYHWIAELSPPRYRAIFSWFGGWITFAYIWLACCSCAMGVAVQVQAYAMIAHPSYALVAQRWHAYLIYALASVVFTLINVFGAKLIHYLNISGIIMHVVGFMLTIIILGVMTKDKHSASYVFTTFTNSSGWSSDGVSFCIGLLTSVYGFGGIDTAAHFSEEISHVRTSVPRAIVWTVIVNAVVTFPWLIMLLYCMGDLESVLSSPVALFSPITQIFANSTGNIGLGIFLAAFPSYLAFLGGVDSLGSASRTLWAMSRDGAFPEVLNRVDPKLDVPVWSIMACAIPQLLLGLIYIGNSTAFYGIISGVLVLYMLSYSICITLHIYAKLSRMPVEYGPWKLGRWSLPLNILALGWTIFTVVFFCFPLYQPVTAASINYASVIVAGLIVIGIVWWLTYLRGHFQGPIVEIVDDGDFPAIGTGISRAETHESVPSEPWKTEKSDI